jgi:fumarate reductase flavoprotein subunit
MGIVGCGSNEESTTTAAPETAATEASSVEAEVSSPEETPAYEIAETVSYDAVVVGCGAAGIQAALTLQAAGVNTVLLEKGMSCGVSNGCMAGGPALAETRVQAENDATVSAKTLYECMYGFSRGTVNGELLRKCINKGEAVVSNFMDNGVNMGLRVDAYGMGFRARHNFANLEGTQVSGADRFQPLVDKFEADGGVFEPMREGLSLVQDGDTVTGLIAKNLDDNTYIQYNAKAVLVATGGYAGNAEMLKEIFGDVSVYPLCNTISIGEGYDMVLAAGGIADRNWGLCCNEFGGANDKIANVQGRAMAFASQAQKFAIYGGLIVNRYGNRFMNEQYLSDRPLALGGEMSLREGRYYAVVDQAMVDGCRDEGILEYLGNPADWYVGQTGLKDVVLSDLDAALETGISEGWIAKGSLAECAAFFGMENLEETVAAYNELCQAGEDDQFYKESYLLKELTGDTYYVIEYQPSIWCTFGGVKTDAYCRALTSSQDVIPGLYVAGVDNGSLYCAPYYENEGAALGTAYTSGIVAGECMIDYINTL